MKPRAAAVISLATLLIAAAIGPGCASTSTNAGSSAAADEHPGHAIARRRCIECHALYSPKRYSDDDWAAIMRDMAGEARLKDEDAALVLQWLQSSN